MPTRAQVQAKRKAAAKKKAAPKKPVRGQRAATSTANQKKKATAKRNVGKTVRAAERQARAAIGDKAFNMQERVADRNVKTLQSKPAPTTPPKKGAAKGAVTRKQNQFKKAAGKAAMAARKGAKSDAVRPTQRAASSVKPAATGAARQTQVAKLLKQGMKRAGILGLGFAAADFAGLTPSLTNRDVRMGRRTQEVQKKAANKKDKGLKKEVIKPKKKPVNIGNVSKAKAEAAARKKEREDAMKERLAARRAEAAKKKAVAPKNVLRDSSGNPVKDSSGNAIRTTDFSKLTQDQIDELYNF